MADMTFGSGPVVGNDCKLYYNLTGTRLIPVWVPVVDVGDVSIPELSFSLAELKRRSNVYTKNLAGLFNSITMNVKLIYGLEPVVYTAIQSQFFNRTVVEWLVVGGAEDTIDVQGLRCPMYVNAFPFSQPLEDVASHDIQLAIGFLTEVVATFTVEWDPGWYTSVGA